MVRDCFDSLQNLSEGRSILINWISAHCGFAGNEAGDMLAKRACNDTLRGPLHSIAVFRSFINLAIREHFRQKRTEIWRSKPNYRCLFWFVYEVYVQDVMW